MVKLLVFGDSISWGAFDDKFGGWVERLKVHFLKSYKTEGVGVYNLAVSSNDTTNLLDSLKQDLEKILLIEPENLILIFSIGSNDCRYQKKGKHYVPLESFKQNIKDILDIAKGYSNHIFFTGILPVDESLTLPWEGGENYWENKDIKEYDFTVRQIANEYGVGFIPLFDVITSKDLSDGTHPNSKGHEKIFTKVKSFLEKILE